MLDNKLEMLANISLANLNTWKVGGCAKHYLKPDNVEQIIKTLKNISDNEQVLWLGLGSNILVRDGGIPGTVIHMHRFDDEIRVIEENDTYIWLEIGAGVSCAKIAKFASKYKLAQAEFFAGIPGTMGGALAMNAGAFGSETWSFVSQVQVLSRSGDILSLNPHDFTISYREVKINLKNFVFLNGTIKLSKKEAFVVGRLKELLHKRNQSQPIGLPSCGSVFKNPENGYAAQLIESSKLKGVRVGGASVSCKHANFMVAERMACAQDIETLIVHVQNTVWYDHGILLQPEVKILGVA